MLRFLKDKTPNQLAAMALMALGGVLLVISLIAGSWQGSVPGQTNGTQEEQRLANTLSTIRGAGRVQVMITYQEQQTATTVFGTTTQQQQPQVAGVIVVAQGAGDLSVRAALLQAVQTALALKPTQVDVFVMQP